MFSLNTTGLFSIYQKLTKNRQNQKQNQIIDFENLVTLLDYIYDIDVTWERFLVY